MARVLQTCIEIEANSEQVWQVLTDFDSWPAWNSTDPGFSGELNEGARVELTTAAPNGKTDQVKITLTSVEPNRQLSWESSVPLLFKARHLYRIETHESGCTLYNEASFGGLLLPFIGKQLPTEEMFNETNRRLKKRIESLL